MDSALAAFLKGSNWTPEAVPPGMDFGPVQDPRDPVRGWKFFLPGDGVFRYHLTPPQACSASLPVLTYVRGTPFDGWQEGASEAIRRKILAAHGVRVGA